MAHQRNLKAMVSQETHNRLWNYLSLRRAEAKEKGETFTMNELVEELLSRSLNALESEKGLML
jgi:hypothetical protein